MTSHRRLSICYAAPGHDLLPSAGPSRNVLCLAETLSQWANVTVASARFWNRWSPDITKLWRFNAIPRYIASADLCLAPYDPAHFPNGQIAYATLNIPEYMACARPVASVPSGHVLRLIEHGVSGFLFHNDAGNWADFLGNCPPREQLKKMGEAAVNMAMPHSWEATARAYLSLCEKAIRNSGKGHVPPSWN